ncbi:MAG: hypothetical protein HKO56_01655 [Bacteroidia bacterium]|nr:hypothetical protein [Bacteroidia bacterium]NNC84554.1 hypothetical protein [Bacteroidia bacterium]NNM15335.1 hypothetical protein [Bacteroidia bacterium]
MQNKRFTIILSIAAIVLLIPLIAMQFTNEVNWTLADFLVGGALLFGFGSLLELTLRKAKNTKLRTALGVAVVLLFLLIWAQLAVGIFDTPFTGH